jgi:hypothetical protein
MSAASEEFSAAPEKSSELSLRECRALVAAVVGERSWDEKLDVLLDRAAHRCCVPKRTVRAIYYGEITDPRHPAVVAIRKAAEHFEIEDLANRFEDMARRLRSRFGVSRGE